MAINKQTIRVSAALLQDIRDALNKVARNSSHLHQKTAAAVANARRQLFAINPRKTHVAKRCTDGPDSTIVHREGFRLGARAVAANLDDCADKGISHSDAFGIALEWLRRRRTNSFAKLVDGSDPEYMELEKDFDQGIKQGLNHLLSALREDYEDQ